MKAIILELKLPHIPSRVKEASAMALNIGYEIVDTIIQKRKSIHHSYTIGKGKIPEIERKVEEKKADVIIFTNTLPSSHIFKLQRVVGNDIKVIDRNLLILELFDKRAMTKEAKLQIQLANLKYTFSWGREYLKLKGILGEQVGWSGPGDYPFKEYQKAAKKRIKKIKSKLWRLRLKKDLLRLRRQELGFPIVALAGYTQSGKTTFFNRVAKEFKNVGFGPFTTLSTFARKVSINRKGFYTDFILIDSIGFIEDMHPIILEAFDSTLNEISDADLTILFIDATDPLPDLIRRLTSSNLILRRIDANKNLILCINKRECINSRKEEVIDEFIKKEFPRIDRIFISAKTGENVKKLLMMISSNLQAIEKPLTI